MFPLLEVGVGRSFRYSYIQLRFLCGFFRLLAEVAQCDRFEFDAAGDVGCRTLHGLTVVGAVVVIGLQLEL